VIGGEQALRGHDGENGVRDHFGLQCDRNCDAEHSDALVVH
jgi:hypothetical protein